MSTGWSWFVAIITIVNIAACYWIIRWTSKKRSDEAAQGDVTGHTWDDNLQEYNNPLPRWWLWLFYITIVFSLVYLVLYPGSGIYKGVYGWSQEKQYEEEMAAANETYGPIFAAYASKDIQTLAKDQNAMAAGQRLFLNHCATCHGSDAGGAPGFPSLTDKAWIFGGSPDAIKSSILDGRPQMNLGQVGMPPMGAAVGGESGAENVANYVLSLSGASHDAAKAEAGKASFAVCAACHGADGSGNQTLGAPNLADNSWIYGGTIEAVKESIMSGRKGQMPAHRDLIGEDKAHLLTAYVYSLSQ